MKIIYLYTTETYQEKNWYKVGETTINPTDRVKQQDNASNPEKLKLLASWQTADWITDKMVHNELEKLGYKKLRQDREWFKLSEIPEDDVEAALIELKANPEEREKSCFYLQLPVQNYTEMWWFSGGTPK
jgi:hypothetical protein